MTDNERNWYLGLGEALRGNRQLRGWTIYDVAAVVGTSGVAVSLWERGMRRMKAYHYTLLRREGLLP
jgi:transcriptional regulator with XRE-family HTH domain